jgi:hypothetical protein
MSWPISPEEPWSIFANGLTWYLCAIAAICISTYIGTLVRAFVAARSTHDSRDPPKLPYAVPLLGNLPAFLWDTKAFLNKIT